MKPIDPHKIEFRNLKREIVYLPQGRVIELRNSSYGLCIVEQRILLIQSAFNDLWELPGGKCDEGEDTLTTMRREFREETGYEVPDQEFTQMGFHREYFYVDSTDNYCDSTMTFYRFHKLGQKLSNELDAHEVKNISWFDENEVRKIKTHPISLKFIEMTFGNWKSF